MPLNEWDVSTERSHSSRQAHRFSILSITTVLTIGALASAPAYAAGGSAGRASGANTSVARTSAIATTDAVYNGSAATAITGWSAYAAAGTVAVKRATGVTGPFAGTTAVSLTRSGGDGDWAMALAKLVSPTTFFTVGKTYRMQAWVRDRTGAGQPIGLMLANGQYAHRPTEAYAGGQFKDTSWHLLTGTFVCTAPASSDTALYIELPGSGTTNFQVTLASVQAVTVPQPSQDPTVPSRVLSFQGPAGSAPDSTVWNYETGGNGWGNGEMQTYTASTSNAALDGNGRLRIATRQETVVGTDGIQRDFTSAKLSTKGKVTINPGSYVEASIQAATGAGIWPAFWFVGTNIDTVGWPACGELDALEGWGSDPTIAHSAVHMGAQNDPSRDVQYGWGYSGGSTDLGQPLDAKPHLYGVYFDQNVVRFYIDHVPTMTVWASDAAASGGAWAFSKPQFMILNVAVPGGVDTSSTTFPKTTTVGDISIWSDRKSVV